MDERFGKIDTGSKVLDFILYFICFGFVFSLIYTLIRIIVVCIAGGAEAYEVKKHNKALKTVVKLLYKYKIQKQDLSVKEVKKLIKALGISGVKSGVTAQEIKDCKFEDWNCNTALSWDGETFSVLPSLTECGVKK